jgi:hypothetical protein
MLNRRRFLQYSVAATAATACVPLATAEVPAAQPHAPKTKPDVIIYDGQYPGWPWVTAAKDGTLFCVFREGTEHGYSATGRALMSVSRDRGRTWSEAATIVDEPKVDDRNVAIAVLAQGDLLVSYNSYNTALASQAMTVRSSDGGKTWSQPRPLDRPNTRTKSAAVTLASGDLLLPYYVAPGNGALAGLSHDHGRTWTTVAVPDAEGFVGDEWDVLEIEPGRLAGVFRNSHPKTDGTFWKSESRDAGRTWSVPKPTNVQSRRHPSPAQMIRHAGLPTLIYADRRMVSVSAVATRDPELLVWDLDRRWPCFVYNADESPIPDGSYPVSAPIDARTRLIVDYEIRSDSKRIAGYFVTLPED